MDFLSRNSILMLEKSVDFLWTKQSAILDNVSNAETPGYRVKTVTFEETLQQQLQRAAANPDRPGAMRAVLEKARPTVRELPGVTRMDDNGVNVTEQSLEMVRNAYQTQYVMSAINSELSSIRIAARGQ